MYLRDLKAMHTEETQGNPRASREVWALRKLTTHSFDSTQDPQDLEAQVRALGRIAGLDYDQISDYINRIWFTTPANTASRGAGSSVHVRSSEFSSPQRSDEASGLRGDRAAGPGYTTPGGGSSRSPSREHPPPATPPPKERRKGPSHEGSPSSPAQPDANALLQMEMVKTLKDCLLYTSDAADE